MTTTSPPQLSTSIKKVREVLSLTKMTIPDYQRPYKWSAKNVHQLIDDLLLFKNVPAYRLGTIVFHKEENGTLNIVDGQQRILTLSLLLLAIQNDKRLLDLATENGFALPVNRLTEKLKFTHLQSKKNIHRNYHEMVRRLTDFDIDPLRFLFDHCEFVVVEINELSEAFQFFDAQNARGKDLDPHDLLKAFHLREINSQTTESELNKLVEAWENLSSTELASAFSDYLFRIRYWSKGQSARYFSKREVDEFKGIQLKDDTKLFPYAGMYKIAHEYANGNQTPFPFQLDQIIINGERFFEYIAHYTAEINAYRSHKNFSERLKADSEAKRILETINNYTARHRTGDQYVRLLFDTALMYYTDKFGNAELERAIEKLFIWAYTLRLERQSVQLASMDNRACASPFVFQTIKYALTPAQFLNIQLPMLHEATYADSNKTDKLNEIVEHFKTLKYIQ